MVEPEDANKPLKPVVYVLVGNPPIYRSYEYLFERLSEDFLVVLLPFPRCEPDPTTYEGYFLTQYFAGLVSGGGAAPATGENGGAANKRGRDGASRSAPILQYPWENRIAHDPIYPTSCDAYLRVPEAGAEDGEGDEGGSSTTGSAEHHELPAQPQLVFVNASRPGGGNEEEGEQDVGGSWGPRNEKEATLRKRSREFAAERFCAANSYLLRSGTSDILKLNSPPPCLRLLRQEVLATRNGGPSSCFANTHTSNKRTTQNNGKTFSTSSFISYLFCHSFGAWPGVRLHDAPQLLGGRFRGVCLLGAFLMTPPKEESIETLRFWTSVSESSWRRASISSAITAASYLLPSTIFESLIGAPPEFMDMRLLNQVLQIVKWELATIAKVEKFADRYVVYSRSGAPGGGLVGSSAKTSEPLVLSAEHNTNKYTGVDRSPVRIDADTTRLLYPTKPEDAWCHPEIVEAFDKFSGVARLPIRHAFIESTEEVDIVVEWIKQNWGEERFEELVGEAG